MTTEFKPGTTVKVDGWRGIAWYVIGPHVETVPGIVYYTDEDGDECEAESWEFYDEVETGEIDVHMVGDDRTFTFDPSELTLLPDGFCCECGQIGCDWDTSCQEAE